MSHLDGSLRSGAPVADTARILTLMAIRVSAVALAFVMTGAPVATTVCQAACAAREMAATPSGAHEHHSCHADAPSNGVALSGVAHACGHSDGDDQIGTDQAVKTFASPALVAVSIAIAPPLLQAHRFGSTRIQHSPPGALSLTTQLRI